MRGASERAQGAADKMHGTASAKAEELKGSTAAKTEEMKGSASDAMHQARGKARDSKRLCCSRGSLLRNCCSCCCTPLSSFREQICYHLALCSRRRACLVAFLLSLRCCCARLEVS